MSAGRALADADVFLLRDEEAGPDRYRIRIVLKDQDGDVFCEISPDRAVEMATDLLVLAGEARQEESRA